MSKFKAFTEALGAAAKGRFGGSASPGEFLDNLLFRKHNPDLAKLQLEGEAQGLSRTQIKDSQINWMAERAGLEASEAVAPYRGFQKTGYRMQKKIWRAKNAELEEALEKARTARDKVREDSFKKLDEEYASKAVDDDYYRKQDQIEEVWKTSIEGQQAAYNAHRGMDFSDMPLPEGFKEAMEQSRMSAFNRLRDLSPGSRPFFGIPSLLINNPKTVIGAGLLGATVGPIDSMAGYAYGGPGYGGYIGFGEESSGGRNNIFQGANVNMNFEAQTMGYNELTSNQILPQGSMGTAPMMSRRMGRQFQNSAHGLTLGLHKGRRGGY